MWKGAALVLLAGLALTWHFRYLIEKSEPPKISYQYWGPGQPKQDSKDVKPFKINVSKEVLNDLNKRLDSWRENVAPLEGAAWTYGMPRESVKKIRDYWRNSYKWEKRQELLNRYPQFTTEVQGLDIHFYHVKPTIPQGKKIRVLPLLLVHGWPGSVAEFQKIIPMLTTPRNDRDFVFEVIAPSIPGYGFSSPAAKPGLGPAQMSLVMKNLMVKLGFNKFYTQGGDWGAFITSLIAALFPQHVLGAHSNMCISNSALANAMVFLGSFWPSMIVDKEYAPRIYPLSKHFSFLLEETGYLHIQATKPDTVGTALTDSPVGLATYILEKFSTWTDKENKLKSDGNLEGKFTMDELLDNVMLYWVTNSITTSMRLYSENFSSKNFNMQLESLPIQVPAGCAAFPHELMYRPEMVLEQRYKKLIHMSHPARGGHFAAFEEPKLMADDIWDFVKKAEDLMIRETREKQEALRKQQEEAKKEKAKKKA